MADQPEPEFPTAESSEAESSEAGPSEAGPSDKAAGPDRAHTVERSGGAETAGQGESVEADGDQEPLAGLTLPLSQVLEGILMVVDEPVSELTLAQVVERPAAEVSTALREMSDRYAEEGRGFALRHVGSGWRFYSADECAPYVERFVLDGQSARLSQAALETLAVVAYQQPVSRGRVSGIRGVSVDGVMRTLVSRGLVCEVGQDESTGATLYGTTSLFLEKMGLSTLEDLPPLAPLLPDIEAILAEEGQR